MPPGVYYSVENPCNRGFEAGERRGPYTLSARSSNVSKSFSLSMRGCSQAWNKVREDAKSSARQGWPIRLGAQPRFIVVSLAVRIHIATFMKMVTAVQRLASTLRADECH